MLDHYESEIETYLRTFRLPPDHRDQIISLYVHTLDDRSDAERRRWKIEQRLARLNGLYQWDDIEPDDHRRRVTS